MTLIPAAPLRSDADILLLSASAPNDAPAGPVPPAGKEPFPASLDRLVEEVISGPDPVRAALEVSRLTVTRMAEELGIPRATLAAYRLGTRRMPAAGRARLAAYLAAHSKALARVARALGAEDV